MDYGTEPGNVARYGKPLRRFLPSSGQVSKIGISAKVLGISRFMRLRGD